MNPLERCIALPFILPMYIAMVPCMLMINSINFCNNKIRILKLFESIQVGSILEFNINNHIKKYFVLFKSDTRIELVRQHDDPANMTRIKIINKDKVLTSWTKMLKNSCKMIDIDLWKFKIIELPDIAKWIQVYQTSFLLSHRFHVYARTIQRTWRAHSKRRKQKAVALIENAVLHAMYKPGGWLAPTRFRAKVKQ